MLNWDRIEADFVYAETLLNDIHAPQPDEYARHKAHLLTGGLVKTSFVPGSAHMTLRFPPMPKKWADRVSEISEDVDLRYRKPGLRSIIRGAIELRHVTPAFFDAWSTVQELTGRIIELREAEDLMFAQYTREITSGISGSLAAHKCWYARWLAARGAIDVKMRREEAQDDLFEICIKAHRHELKCPLHPDFYDARWFRRLLRKNGKKINHSDKHKIDLDLNSSLVRISTRELRVLISDPFLVAAVLPPLRRSDFVEISNAP